MPGEAAADVDPALCDCGEKVDDMPAHAVRRLARSVADDMKLPRAEREAELERRRAASEARERLLREEAERKAGNREAMKDPKKAAMFEMMAKNFPGIPVTFKKDSSWRDNIPTDAQTQL